MKANKIREYKFEDLLKNKMKNKLFREEYENLEKVDFNKDIQLIKEAILNNIEVKYIYLFGSYAYGKPNENSDIDIYVVLPDKYNNFTEIYAKIISDLSDKNIFFIDLLLVNETIFNSRKNDYILEKTIYNKGKLLYES